MAETSFETRERKKRAADRADILDDTDALLAIIDGELGIDEIQAEPAQCIDGRIEPAPAILALGATGTSIEIDLKG